MKPHVEYTNKEWEKRVAKSFPSKCTSCKYASGNLVKKTYYDGLGSAVFVECPKCGWRKEITPYDLV